MHMWRHSYVPPACAAYISARSSIIAQATVISAICLAVKLIMWRHHPKYFLLLIASLMNLNALADSTIVILRHGEKPGRGLGQLSCQGLNRALALPPILLSRYGVPVAIYL